MKKETHFGIDELSAIKGGSINDIIVGEKNTLRGGTVV